MAFLNACFILLHVVQEAWPAGVLVAIIFKLLYNRYSRGLSSIPGPTLHSISEFPRAFQVWAGKIHENDLAMHKRYGKLVRVGPKLLSLSDVSEMNTIYGITTKFYKSSFYDPSTPYDEEGIVPDPFILKDKAMHSRMKRNAANAYSLTAILQLEPFADEVASKLFKVLDREAETPNSITNFGHHMHAFAMDAIFMISFGKSLNIVEEGDRTNLLACFDTIMPYMATVGQIPWAHKYLAGNPYVAKLILGEMTFETGLMQIATSQVESYKKTLNEAEQDVRPMTFVERLLLNQKSNPKSLTDREMITHALGNITAGGDTTSITLRSIFYYSLKHPDSWKRLVEEIRTHCVFPTTFASAQNLPYLQAVVKEALRLHPPMPIMLGRTVPKGGALVCGKFLPAGVEIGIPAYVLHRDPEIFKDPEAWKPERWLTNDAAHLTAMNRAFFAFGGGQHTCSGKHISMMEITKLVPSLILRYDFELAYPDRPWTFRVSMLAPQKSVYVKLRKRI
ncbi:cytochrome P450 oxidoreductase [Pyrenochaeta sp. DS3sAY3a]|nr:cytochrome P450 oxidoreductase [Pyrenochaeta sp. DS3sAY3a]